MATDKQAGPDKALAGELAKARAAKADKPMFFAMVLKGGDGALLVDRKKIAPAAIAAAKKESGGSTVVEGLCFGEEGALIFETAKPPAGNWAAAAKKIAKESAGVSINAEFRQGRDVENLPESESREQQSTEEAGSDQAAAQWTQRSKAIAPRLLAALKANQGDVTKMRAVFAFAQQKAEGKDYAKALTALDNLEKLLPGAAAPAGQSGDGKANLGSWTAAREDAIKQLKAVAVAVAATKDPDAPKVIVELQSIIKNLTAAPTTPQQIDELTKYLSTDDLVAVEEVPPEFGTLNIRKPLLAALAKLKA